MTICIWISKEIIPISATSFTLNLISDPVVLTLNKLTNLSFEDCIRITNENNNDLEKSLKQAYLQIYKPPFNILNGNWFSTIIPTRSRIYLFKLYSSTPIYNNRNNWELRNSLNKLINTLPLNTEMIFKLEVATGIMLHSCIGLKYDATMFGFYLHKRVNDSIYKGLALTITSSTPTQQNLIPLTRFLCRLSYFRTPIPQTNVLSNITNETFETNFIKATQKLIQTFNKTNNCTATLRRVFIIK
ncbi:elongation factor EF-Ts [Candidatus Hodgkinia cicadicola]|uniref:Elongation factor EF-Ts n=1 Tax=Candidatus Hodgkinia cicadicola TaxID=573658 RepID=A0ABX4MI49_9HYPH|nr:elongation factor EF-Ts [Candidatus Hodgkinia cicadicola]PIM96513.1 elongation factor EF-Ts [Candidatus Hodgkinia cicadicola]PIM96520.1 elongation factor EF-Ts [Candidatus Hodgkinia cicadicola]